MTCIICYKDEPYYNERVSVDLTCSACVQRLLRFSQDELLSGYLLAGEKGYIAKSEALYSFMTYETRRQANDEQTRDRTKELSYGAKPHGTFKNEQKSNCNFERARPSLYPPAHTV